MSSDFFAPLKSPQRLQHKAQWQVSGALVMEDRNAAVLRHEHKYYEHFKAAVSRFIP